MTGRPTVETILVARYRCRDEEGGCGARIGERCKTHLRGRITQPHQDRWTQWHLHGSPGAWWHENERPKVKILVERIERNLAAIEADLELLAEVAIDG